MNLAWRTEKTETKIFLKLQKTLQIFPIFYLCDLKTIVSNVCRVAIISMQYSKNVAWTHKRQTEVKRYKTFQFSKKNRQINKKNLK